MKFYRIGIGTAKKRLHAAGAFSKNRHVYATEIRFDCRRLLSAGGFYVMVTISHGKAAFNVFDRRSPRLIFNAG